MKQHYWELQNTVTANDLEGVLQAHFAITVSESASQKYTLYDDNDWSLWHSQALLLDTKTEGIELVLNDRKITAKPISLAKIFFWDLPEGELREEIKSRIKLRALLPHATFSLQETRLDLLNEDQKIVVRLALLHYQKGRTSVNVVELTPLRGYTEEFDLAKQHCAAFMAEHQAEALLDDLNQHQLLRRIGITPAEPKKKNYGIHAFDASEKAVRHMAKHILEQTVQQTDGIIQDIDTEFLHDYRVNLRKARSLVTLTKTVFKPASFNRLKQYFSALASPTGRLRDLDVFLLDEHYYRKLLPNISASGLDELFALMRKERQSALKKVCTFIKTKRFASHVTILQNELARAPDFASDAASQPILSLAQQQIYKRYRRVCKHGLKIDDATPDSEIHAIRKDCKKLRYLMEFFTELFPAKRMNTLVKQLKKLQDILGRFNDVSVQQEFLGPYTDTAQYSEDLALSVAGLVAVLHHQQIQERQRISAALTDFADEEVHVQFKLLFSQ